MPDYAKTYSTLVVQPVDLVNAFKLDFCFASVIKWLTKWHIDKKSENLIKAKYYTALCTGTTEPVGFRFALRMYCVVNGFMKVDSSSTCMLLDVVHDVMKGDIDNANLKLSKAGQMNIADK